MGQKSLPRLEKIETVMSWESAIFTDKAWLGPKTFFITKLFSQHFMKRAIYFKKFKNKQSLCKQREALFKTNKKKKKYQKTVVGSYIYPIDNQYISLIVYFNSRLINDTK